MLNFKFSKNSRRNTRQIGLPLRFALDAAIIGGWGGME